MGTITPSTYNNGAIAISPEGHSVLTRIITDYGYGKQRFPQDVGLSSYMSSLKIYHSIINGKTLQIGLNERITAFGRIEFWKDV